MRMQQTGDPSAPPRLEPLEPRLLLSGDLYISEFMAINNYTLADEDGDYSDWIEIHNAGDSDVNLEDWGLTDDESRPTKWQFPAVTVPAGEYLVVFASDKDRAVAGEELHTNFKLSGDGEYLGLARPDGTIEHEYSPEFPEQVGDVSYGVIDALSAQTLLPAGVEMKYTVPTGPLDTTWMNEGYDDSSWTAGLSAMGYDNEIVYVPGGTITLVEAGADARGLVPSSDIGTSWRGLGYDPTGWLSGGTGLGYDTGVNYDPMINLDVESQMYGVRTSAYLRVEFEVTDPSRLTSLELQMKYDDGFVAWINGTEVYSVYAPTPLEWDSASTGQVSPEPTPAGSYESYDVSAYLSELVAGTNVLAIQALNRSLTSSDLLALPRLVADITVPTYAYEAHIETDVEAEMAGQNASACMRVPFVVEGTQLPDSLLLKVKYDDGFMAWINGVQVALRNAPGSPQWNSTAMAEHPDALAMVYDPIDISAYVGALQLGSNVLAIQAMNLTAGDSDFLIVPELAANWTEAEVHRYFTVPTPGSANGTGSTDLGPIITEVGHSPAIPSDSDDLVVTARVQPAFAPVADVSMTYRVMFGGETTVVMYDDGLHDDGDPGDGVYGAVIPAGVSSPGQMVRYYLTASDGSASSRWPLFADSTGGRQSSEYLGTVVQDDSYAGTQLPVFHFFVESPVAADTRTGTRGAVFFMGELYDNVYIRERGGTINGGVADGQGQSRKIEFNDDHRFLFDPNEDRVGEINVNCPGPQDGSYLRQELSFWLYDLAGVPGEITFLMHVRQNGAFMGVRVFHDQLQADELEREGLDEDGTLYYVIHSWLSTSDYMNFEKKNPKPIVWDPSDLQALAYGIDPNNPDRHLYVMDNLNLPALVNYLAVEALIQDGDCTTHNYYVYRDPDTGEWMYIGHDRDLTWGDWVDAGADWSDLTPWGEKSNYGDRYWMHPFYANSDDPHADVYGRGWVRLTDAVHDDPVGHQMFYRRLRTLMDEFLKPPGTPYAEMPIEQRIDWWVSQMAYEQAHNMLPPQGGAGGEGKSFTSEINKLKNYYVAGRRDYLYGELGPYIRYNPYGEYWYRLSGQDSAVPDAQPAAFSGQIIFGVIDHSPVSGNQEEEYIELFNPNDYAVDISGWELDGAITFTLPPGTVICPGGTLYVSPNATAFRARQSGPSGGQGLLVVGPYEGHISWEGEPLWLRSADGVLIDSTQAGSDSVVINEVLTHSNGPEGDWIELHNQTPSAVDIGGWYLSDDPSDPMKYQIPGGTTIDAGEYLVFTETAHFGELFALSRHGDEVVLADGDGVLVDKHDFAASDADLTYGLHVTDDGTGRFVLLSAPTPGAANAYPLVGPVVINEIMYHPLDGQAEFLELHNITDAAVPLYDPAAPAHTWEVHGGVDFTFPAGTVIPPGGFVVVTEVDVSDPPDEAAFRAQYGIPAGVGVFGPYLGNLSNGGETVRLSRPETDPDVTLAYVPVDAVRYDDEWPWPVAPDGQGASLERMDVHLFGNDRRNWQGYHVGGSAGTANPLLAGDADGDGAVNGADYTIWADRYGQPGGWIDGDFNGDDEVDGADYTLWADNYGAGQAGGTAASEPQDAVLAPVPGFLAATVPARGSAAVDLWESAAGPEEAPPGQLQPIDGAGAATTRPPETGEGRDQFSSPPLRTQRRPNARSLPSGGLAGLGSLDDGQDDLLDILSLAGLPAGSGI